MNNQRGFIVPVILIIVGIVLAASIVGILVVKKSATTNTTVTTNTTTTTNTVANANVTTNTNAAANANTSTDETAGWKTYTHSPSGLSFKYPEGVEVKKYGIDKDHWISLRLPASTDPLKDSPYFTDGVGPGPVGIRNGPLTDDLKKLAEDGVGGNLTAQKTQIAGFEGYYVSGVLGPGRHGVVPNTQSATVDHRYINAYGVTWIIEYDAADVTAIPSLDQFRVLLSTIQLTSPTAGWKTYTNTKYGYSLQYPKGYTIISQSTDENVYWTNASGESVLDIQYRIESVGGALTTWFDHESEGTITLGGRTGKKYLYRPSDAGQTGSERIAYVVQHQSKLLGIEFIGDKTLDSTEEQILSTFQFTE